MSVPNSQSDRIARRICAGAVGIAGAFFSLCFTALLPGVSDIQAGNVWNYSLGLGSLGLLAGISFYTAWIFWRASRGGAHDTPLSPKFFIGFGIFLYALLLVTLGLNLNHLMVTLAAGLAVGVLATALFQKLMKPRLLRMLWQLERSSRKYAASQTPPPVRPRPGAQSDLQPKDVKLAKRTAAARLAAFYNNPVKARAVLRTHPQESDPVGRELKALEQAAAHATQLRIALRQQQDKKG